MLRGRLTGRTHLCREERGRLTKTQENPDAVIMSYTKLFVWMLDFFRSMFRVGYSSERFTRIKDMSFVD